MNRSPRDEQVETIHRNTTCDSIASARRSMAALTGSSLTYESHRRAVASRQSQAAEAARTRLSELGWRCF